MGFRKLRSIPSFFPNAAAALSITNYLGNTQMTHPDIVDFGNGNAWNGYRFWMAATPYPNSDSTKENPSIWASNDGTTWVVPVGLTNPVIPDPGGTTYNSDPTMVYVPKLDKLVMFYRTTSGTGTNTDVFRQISSSDGVTWANDQAVITWGASATVAYLSPQVYYNLATDSYIMWTIEYSLSLVRSRNVFRMTSSDGITWSSAQAIPFNRPIGWSLWHFNIKAYGGILYGVVATFKGSNPIPKVLHYFQSNDLLGLQFNLFNDPIMYPKAGQWDSYTLYQSCMLNVDGTWKIWYAAQNNPTWGIGLATNTVSQTSVSNRQISSGRTLATLTPPIFDSFTRVDSASSLGSTEQGNLSWTQLTGTFGISSGKAYTSAVTADAIAYIDAGSGDVDVSITFDTYNDSGSLFENAMYFRVTDISNWWRIVRVSNTLLLQKRQAASNTTIVTLTLDSFTAGDRFRVIAQGSSITIFQNANQIYRTSNTFNTSATKHGFGNANGSIVGRYTNFSCQVLNSGRTLVQEVNFK